MRYLPKACVAAAWGGLAVGAAHAAPVLTPPVTTGLVFHVDANDIDGDGVAEGAGEAGLSGSSVSAWSDTAVADGQQNATQAAAANQPLYTPNGLNGLPVVSFVAGSGAATNDFMKTSVFSPVAQPQVFIVWKSNTTAANVSSIAVDGLGTTNRTLIDYEYLTNTPAGHRFGSYAGGTGQIANYSPKTDFPNAVYETVTFNANGTGRHNIRLNGVQVANNTSTNDRGDAFTGFTLGALQDGTLPLNGYIAELLVYNAPLTSADRDAVEGYLNQKWFVPVPEPTASALLAFGGLALFRRRQA